MAAQKALDLSEGEDVIHKEIMDLFFEQERQSERDLWEKIRSGYICAADWVLSESMMFYMPYRLPDN